ncbi:MAG: peptidylprolyl isomerase [Sutterella wadsworthensis]
MSAQSPTSSRPSKPPATRSSSTPSCATGPRKTRSRTKTSASAYEAEKAAYGPTEYQVRHILVKTEDQAKNIISRLNKGADFDKLAKEFSEDRGNKDRGGQLGWVVRSFVPTLRHAVAGMKKARSARNPCARSSASTS